MPAARHLGKLSAAVAFVTLLLASSLPLISLCFLLGGVSPGEVGASFALLVLTAFVYGAAGVAWSAVARNTTTATVLSYGTAGLLFFGTIPLFVPNAPGFYSGVGGLVQSGLRALNPVGAAWATHRPVSSARSCEEATCWLWTSVNQ